MNDKLVIETTFNPLHHVLCALGPWTEPRERGDEMTFAEIVDLVVKWEADDHVVLWVGVNGDERLRVDADGGVYVRGEKVAQA